MELKKDYFIKCISKKNIALKNAEYIQRIGIEKINEYGEDFKNRLIKRSKRIIDCLSYWQWDKYEGNKIMDLVKLFRCKDLFCPNCRTWRVAKAIINFNPFFKDLLIKGYCPYFMTLTVPNVKGEFLNDEIDKLNKGFYTMWRWLSSNGKKGYGERLFKIIGAVKAIELTINKERYDINIHIHAIVFLEGENRNDFNKIIPGGYRKKSDEYIYYSNADIFVQKIWTMAYKEFNLTNFDDMSDDWKDNYICDIREL